jgi:hypothetical protein
MVLSRRPDETDAEYLARLAVEAQAPAEDEDVWQLQRGNDESDEDFAVRCAALGCDAQGNRKFRRWSKS